MYLTNISSPNSLKTVMLVQLCMKNLFSNFTGPYGCYQHFTSILKQFKAWVKGF